MYSLQIALKQHTPLIHFQHDQEGATLRASEVKPRLDRFILNQLGKKSSSEEKDKIRSRYKENVKKWDDYQYGFKIAKEKGLLIGNGEKPALNYKMRINPEGEVFSLLINQKIRYNESHEKENKYFLTNDSGHRFLAKLRKDKKLVYDLKKYPSFFGNIDTDITNYDEYKKFTFTESSLKLNISSDNNNIIELFKNSYLISYFFLNHNFGNRQSKGFGSFYIDPNDNLYKEVKSSYNFLVEVSDENFENEFYDLFYAIELFSNSIRSGINEKKFRKTVFYFKSLLFMYCKEVLIAQWDKKTIKENFYQNKSVNSNDNLEKQQINHKNQDYDNPLFNSSEESYDIKDLMGFSTNESWMTYRDSIEKKIAIKENGEFRYPRRNETLPVERLKSPILIKPIYNDDNSYIVHLIFQEEQVNLKEFMSYEKICIYSKKKFGNQSFMIDIPDSFSIKKFFDYIFNTLKFDISGHVADIYHSNNSYIILEKIYTQLKQNIKK